MGEKIIRGGHFCTFFSGPPIALILAKSIGGLHFFILLFNAAVNRIFNALF